MPIKRNNPKPTGVRGIKKDGPNRFLVCTTFRDPKTGKEVRREGVARSLTAAAVLKEELRNRPRAARRSRVRFGDFAEQWISERVNELAESTKGRYMNALAHLMVRFGSHWIDAIEPADLRKWQNVCLASYAPATVNGWLRILRQVLSVAEQDGLVARNAARDVRSLREKRTKGRRGQTLTAEQFALFYSGLRKAVDERVIAEDVERMLVVVGWSGVRRGELLAMRFADVEGDALHIRRSVWKQKVKETKTDDPRIVPYTGPLAEAVEAQRRWLIATQHEGLASGLVFPAQARYARAGARRRGTEEISWFRSGQVLRDPIAKVVERAGLPAITLHSFRRTYENLLREAGVSDLVRRSLAGWRTEAAQSIYASVADNERAAAVVAMEGLMQRALASKLRPELRPDPQNAKRPAEADASTSRSH